MNPIDFLKIRTFFDNIYYKKDKDYKIYDDSSVDIISSFGVFIFDYSENDIKLFPESFDYTTNQITLPFKFRNVRDYFEFKSNGSGCRLHLKSLRNFPDVCKNVFVSRDIIVDSLEGIGFVGHDLRVSMKHNYKTKEDVLKDYPNLKIGGRLILQPLISDYPFQIRKDKIDVFSTIIIFNDKEK